MDLMRVIADSLAVFKKNALALVAGGIILCVVGVACLSGPAMILGFSLELNDSGQVDLGSMGAQILWVFLVTAALMVCIVMPLAYGLLNVSLQFATEGRVGGVGGVFSGLRRWGAIALFVLLKALLYTVIAVGLAIPVGILAAILAAMFGWFGFILGYLLFLAPFVYFEIIWLYVPAVLYDQEAGLADAMRSSRQLVRRQAFLPTLLCVALPVGIAVAVGVVGALFFEALGLDPQVVSIGGQVIQYAVFTPWLFAVIVVMYLQAGGRSADLEAALTGRPIGSPQALPYGMLPQGPSSGTPFPSANPFPSAMPSSTANKFPSAMPSSTANPFPSAMPAPAAEPSPQQPPPSPPPPPPPPQGQAPAQ